MSNIYNFSNSGKRWSEDDDNYLLENCSICTMDNLLKYLKRTQTTIESRIYKLIMDNEESVDPKDYKYIDIKSIIDKHSLYNKNSDEEKEKSKILTKRKLTKLENDINEIKNTLHELLYIIKQSNKEYDDKYIEYNYLVFDLETTEVKSFDNLTSVLPTTFGAMIYDTNNKLIKTICIIQSDDELSMNDFCDQIKLLFDKCKILICFNSLRFDWIILKNIFPIEYINKWNLKSIDPIQNIKKFNSKNCTLNNLAIINNVTTKNGDGKDAPKLYNNKDYVILKKYCLNDVKILWDLWMLGNIKLPNGNICEFSQLNFGGKIGR